MGIETDLKNLTKAVQEQTEAIKENTAQHAAFAEIAKAAGSGKSTGEAASDDAEEKAKAPAKKTTTRKTTTRKTTKKPAAKKKIDPVTEVSAVELRDLAKTFMSDDDQEERDRKKALFASALDHLGAEKLSDVSEDDEDRAKLATYIAHWNAGQEPKFAEMDELIGDAADAEEESEDDDMLD